MAALFTGQSMIAQKGVEDGSKFGHGQDSIECLRNLSLYREYTRQNDFAMALPYWRKTFLQCPLSSKNVYLDGVKIFRYLIEKEKDQNYRSAYVDTLMLVYETRIKYFDQIDEVRGRQGIDLLRYKRDDIQAVQQAYGYLKESVNLADEKASEAVIATYFSASITLFQNQKLPAAELIADFLITSEILSAKITSSPSDTTLVGLQETLIKNFVQVNGISETDVLTAFGSAFNEKPNESPLLKVIVAVLDAKKLSETDLWLNAAKNLYAQYPSAELAEKIGFVSLKKYDFKVASNYYNQALQLQTDNSKKAESYYWLALSTDNLDNKPLARDYAYKAIELKPNWGDPFILIAQLYATSRDLCQGISLPNAIYWVAVDKLIKAKQVDPSVETKANRLIMDWSPHFPNKEEAFFLNIMEGSTYNVGCWINENTRARF